MRILRDAPRPRAALVAAAAFLLSACHDNALAPTRLRVPAYLTVAIRCEARPAARSVSCGAASGAVARTPAAARDSARRLLARASAPLPSPAPGERGRVRQAIIGGQDQYLRLSQRFAQYDAVLGTFTVLAELTNLLPQPLGTLDGVAGADSTFPKVVFVGGSGVPLLANPTGTGTFTGSGQPYVLYPEVVLPGETTNGIFWQFTVGNPPVVFDFSVLISARLPDESIAGFFLGEKTFEALATGGQSACAVRPLNALYCWGDNANGQLANGRIDRLGPTPITLNQPLAQDFVSLAAGEQHACGINASGQLHCWGDNQAGQNGRGFLSVTDQADSVVGGKRYLKVAAGGRTTCAIQTDNLLRCWGENASGQVGDNTQVNRPAPVAVVGLSTPLAVDVAVGERHACAVLANTDLYCWGANDEGQIGTSSLSAIVAQPALVTSGVSRVVLGTGHSCALLTTGSAICWGRNGEGQVGASTPNLIEPSPVNVVQASAYTAIAAGGNTTCALRADNGLTECWGDNTHGQVGDASYTNRRVPTLVSLGLSFVELSVGGRHACGRTAANAVHCWGDNNAFQLGTVAVTGSSGTPVLSALTGTAIAAGAEFLCVKATAGGGTSCSGSNTGGAIDAAVVRLTNRPVGVAGTLRFASVSMGERFGCGITAAGAMACWGANDEAQLGQSFSGDVITVPVLVPHPQGGTWKAVSAGRAHACAIDDQDRLLCWGANRRGQLAQDGTSPFETRPQFAESSVLAVSAGEDHVCVVLTFSQIECWGRATEGQVGYGGLTDQENPVRVTLPAGLVPNGEIAAGGRFTCATVQVPASNGAVYCWGANDAAQLGNTGALVQPSPVLLSGGLPLGVLVAGARHACGNAGNNVHCWGSGGVFEQARDPSAGPATVPTALGSVMNVLKLAGGSTSSRSCALFATATPQCWGGRQTRGERGDAAISVSSAPTSPGLP